MNEQGGLLRDFVGVFSGLNEILARPGVQRRFIEFLERMDVEYRELPKDVVRAFADSGMFLHSLRLSHPDVVAIVKSFQEEGQERAVALTRSKYKELVESEQGRSSMVADWAPHARWPVLQQILAAHEANLYGVAIPAAIAQAEGVMADLIRGDAVQGVGRGDLQAWVDDLASEEDGSGPSLKQFFQQLLRRFQHGENSGDLARHEIMHGGSFSYGTRENSILAILWLDFAILVSAEASRRVIGATPRAS